MARRFFHLLSAAAPAADHVPDADLLRRFAATRDAAAFELLVRRHADAVWAAAYRVLRHHADAEDAFQAAFLVLARKAGSVRGPSAGGWLHRVTVNAALKLKASRACQRPRDVPDPAVHTAGSPETDELAAVVHQELARLPDRYRLPVVLCDLEGHTHADAARALGWPVGSVSGRLSRAHALLRDRLARRGLAPVVVAAAAAPPSVIRAAAAVAAGSFAVPPVVSTLAEGVLSAMRTAKLKLTAAVAAGLLGLAGAGTVVAVGQAPGSGPGPKADPPPPKAAKADPAPAVGPEFTAFPALDPKSLEDLVTKCPLIFGEQAPVVWAGDDDLSKLKRARVMAARAELRRLVQRLKIGHLAEPAAVVEACYRVVTAAHDGAGNLEESRKWFAERVLVAKWYEKIIEAGVKVGNLAPDTLDRARYARLDAEIALAELDRRAKAPVLGR
jgi:RNA polymerase sigma factor (sigma-70 family)